jgi:hypothetical protein
MAMGIQFMIWTIADWWYQMEEMHSKYTNLGNHTRNILDILRLAVVVAVSALLG